MKKLELISDGLLFKIDDRFFNKQTHFLVLIAFLFTELDITADT